MSMLTVIAVWVLFGVAVVIICYLFLLLTILVIVVTLYATF